MASTTKPNLFRQRTNTLKKKTFELATLCGIDALLIVFEEDGPNSIGHRRIEPQTWPESPDEVRRILKRYSDCKDSGPPERKRRKIDVVEEDCGRESEIVNGTVETLSWEDANRVLAVLDSKLLMVQKRIQELEEKKKGIQCSAGAPSVAVTDSEDEAISLLLMDGTDYGMGLDPLLQPQPWNWQGLCNGDIEDALSPRMDGPDLHSEGLDETTMKKSTEETNFFVPELWIDGPDPLFPSNYSDAALSFSELMKDSDLSLSFNPLFQSESLSWQGSCDGEIEYTFPLLMDDGLSYFLS